MTQLESSFQLERHVGICWDCGTLFWEFQLTGSLTDVISRYFQDKFPFPFLLCFGIKDLDLEAQRREREVEDLQEQLSKTAADARHCFFFFFKCI